MFIFKVHTFSYLHIGQFSFTRFLRPRVETFRGYDAAKIITFFTTWKTSFAAVS